MIANLLLVCGVAVLSWALRTFSNPLLRRLGTIGILVTSFLAGWLLGGHIALGILFALSWFLLPWLEILTRIRQLRLPIHPELKECAPPNEHRFPGIHQLTEEIEHEQFEHVTDACWENNDLRHFFRIFYHPSLRIQTALCLVEEERVSFYYISLLSRSASSDEEFVTWNYPFSYGMKTPPEWHIQRVTGDLPFSEILKRHLLFLSRSGLACDSTAPQPAETTLPRLRERGHRQIEHNLRAGLLLQTDENRARYSLRGMFFLWRQFLLDLFRYS